ncbi:MAG: GTP-binding protein [Candidatus Lokiarchaeota archaeon]|nr:GTP-binding protein [Candidatus Lokiarchaeota archaeon]
MTNINRLIKLLESEDVEKKKKALMEISKLKDPQAVKPLLNQLKDMNDDIRMWAAEGLGDIGDASPYVVDALIDALLDSNELVRESAEKAIQKIDPTFSNLTRKQIFQEYRRRYLLEKKFSKDFELETDKFKIIMVGDSEVGKTAFVKRWTLDKFLDTYKMTASANISNKIMHIDGRNLELELWDLAGQESLLVSDYFFGASGALLLFDKTSEDSIKNLEKWYTKIRELSGKIPILIVGNKYDLAEEINKKGEKFANKKKMGYIETSVKTGLNIQESFNILARDMLEEQDKFEETPEYKTLMKDLTKRQQYFYDKFKKYVKNASYFCKIKNFDNALEAFKKGEIFAKKADFPEGIQWIEEQKKYCEMQIAEGFKIRSSFFCKQCNRIYQLIDDPELVCPVCKNKNLTKVTQLRSLFAPLLARFLDKEEFDIQGEYFDVFIDMILEVRFVNAWNFVKYYQKEWNLWQIEVNKIDWSTFLENYGGELLTAFLREVFLFDEAKLMIELKEPDVKSLQMEVEYIFESKNMQDIQTLLTENKIEYISQQFEQRFFNSTLRTLSNYLEKIIPSMKFTIEIIESKIREDFEGVVIRSAMSIQSELMLI